MRQSHFESSKTGMRPAVPAIRLEPALDLPRNGSNGPEFHSSLRRYQRYEELERGRQGCGRWGLRGQQASRHLEWGLGEPAIPLEAQFSEIASYIALVIEAGAVLVVAFGASQALAAVITVVIRRSAGEMEGRQIWIRFATWILLALEFALAADLVRTAVAPTWDDIAKLAVIATIRTMRNYFLAKDIAAIPSRNPLQIRPLTLPDREVSGPIHWTAAP
jgi:uncharacterized membrane protein